MIREIGEAIGDTVVESVGRAVGRTQEQRPLAADLLESDEAYLAVFDVPGVEAGDVQVRFEDGTVFVRADRFRDFHEGFEMRFPGRGLTLDGSLSLPDDAAVDPDAASATLKANGTLQIEIPKVEETDGESPDEPEPEAVEVDDGDESDDGEDEVETADETAEDGTADETDEG